MIRINLLGTSTAPARKRFAIGSGAHTAALCGLIAVATVVGIGWWHWTLTQESERLDEAIASAAAEQARVRTLIAELAQFEARRGTLRQRVQLIEQLRGGQTIPVQLLDHVSRSLPEMMWLTSLAQDGDAMTIEGRSTTLFALSDFVGNLAKSDLLQKPVEIVNSQAEASAPQNTASTDRQELIRFTVKALVAKATAKAAAPPSGAASATVPNATAPAPMAPAQAAPQGPGA